MEGLSTSFREDFDTDIIHFRVHVERSEEAHISARRSRAYAFKIKANIYINIKTNGHIYLNSLELCVKCIYY